MLQGVGQVFSMFFPLTVLLCFSLQNIFSIYNTTHSIKDKVVAKAHFATETHFSYIHNVLVFPFKSQIQNTTEITGTVCQLLCIKQFKLTNFLPKYHLFHCYQCYYKAVKDSLFER